MDFEKALSILGLSRTYTNEDLRRAYRTLIKKYHPDKYQGQSKIIAEEKTKQINDARDVLEKHLQNKPKEPREECLQNEKLGKLKIRYIQECKNELEYINKIDPRDKVFAEWKANFIEVIYSFYEDITTSPITALIQKKYKMYRNNYHLVLYFYKNELCTKSKIIDFGNGSLKINDTDSLKDVRTKSTTIINEILNKELEEFKTFNESTDVKILLYSLRDVFTKLCLWGYIDIEKAKIDFKNRIVEEINKYSKRKQMIDELIKYQGYSSPLVVELRNNILYEDKFNSIYNEHLKTSDKIKMKIKNLFSKQ